MASYVYPGAVHTRFEHSIGYLPFLYSLIIIIFILLIALLLFIILLLCYSSLYLLFLVFSHVIVFSFLAEPLTSVAS